MKSSVIAKALVLVPVLCCGLVFGQAIIGGQSKGAASSSAAAPAASR